MLIQEFLFTGIIEQAVLVLAEAGENLFPGTGERKPDPAGHIEKILFRV